MIVLIIGEPRVGKTALMSSFALERMTGENAAKDIRQSCKIIKKFNDGGYHFTYPKGHLVYTDYDLWTRNKTVLSRKVSGYNFGLPTSKSGNVGFYPPCSNFFFDEAHKYWSSRAWSSFASSTGGAFEVHGHNKYTIYIIVHDIGMLDKNIRSLSSQVIEVVDLKHKYDNGVLLASTWKTKVYEGQTKIRKLCEGADVHGKTKYFHFDGNIFKHYDSEGQKYLFYRDKQNSDFDLDYNKIYDYTVDSVNAFNEEHYYAAPEDLKKRSVK